MSDADTYPIGREYERRFYDLFDFYRARRFADLLLPILETEELARRYDIHEPLALWTALVISYARPFTRNIDSTGVKEPKSVSRKLKEHVPKELLARHEYLIDARHRAMAHSDRTVAEIKRIGVRPGSRDWVDVMNRGWELPEIAAAREARALADHLFELVGRRWDELRPNVEPGFLSLPGGEAPR